MATRANKEETVETDAPVASIATVYGKAAPGSSRGPLLFEGLVEDAEAFILNHFPRLHSEEVGPDFTVSTNDGTEVSLPPGYPSENTTVETDETAPVA